MAVTTPRLLLVPPLYEESTATISWEATEADSYELDIVFDDDYDGGARGWRWSDLEAADWTWVRQEGSQSLSWQAFHELAAFLTVFNGTGEDVSAPDQGLAWGNLDSAGWSWTEQEGASGRSWKELQLLPSVGLTWGQHDLNALTWTVLESTYSSWATLENLPTRGLCWASLQGLWLSWGERQAWGGGLTWLELDHLPPDNRTHKGTEVEIPLYTKSSMLRIRGKKGQQEPSGYLMTARIPHLPRSLAKYKPPCLHLPEKIYEEGTAKIVWGDLYGAEGFLLERQINGGSFAEVFRGRGPASQISCQVLEQVADVKDHFSYTADIPLYAKTVAFRVRAYNSTDASMYLTSKTVDTLPRSLEKYKPPCLHIPPLHEGTSAEITWGDLYGASGYRLERQLDGGYESRYDGPGRVIPHPAGCNQPQLHAAGPDCKKHLACSDAIPYYQKTARYRIRGYNTTDSSQILESGQVAIIPLFYREDSLSLSLAAGERYELQLLATDMVAFEGIVMTLQYPASALSVSVDTGAGLENAPAANSEILSHANGQLRFRGSRAMRAGKAWDGVLLSLDCTARQTTTAVLTLS